jgi:hypothetical protein
LASIKIILAQGYNIDIKFSPDLSCGMWRGRWLKNSFEPVKWGAAVIGLFCLKLINLNVLLGLSRVNNFIDPVIQLADFVLILWLVTDWGNLLTRRASGLKILAVLGALSLPLILSGGGLAEWLHFIQYTTRLTALLAGLYFIFTTNRRNFWPWITVLGLYSLFDHLLLSSGLAALVLYLATRFQSLAKSNPGRAVKVRTLLTVWLVLNALLAIYQVGSGHSLGLAILGEPPVDIGLRNVAKQELGSFLWLRGYGLTLHPNILGFCATILGFSLFYKQSGRLNQVTMAACFICIVLSFSRLAWLGAGFLVFTPRLIQFLQEVNSRRSKVMTTALGLGFGLLLTILFVARQPSDSYRIKDLINLISAFQIPPDQWITGLGLGQYPFWLKTSQPWLASWEWQPVHGLWLNLVVELGLVGMIAAGLAVYSVFRQQMVSKP